MPKNTTTTIFTEKKHQSANKIMIKIKLFANKLFNNELIYLN